MFVRVGTHDKCHRRWRLELVSHLHRRDVDVIRSDHRRSRTDWSYYCHHGEVPMMPSCASNLPRRRLCVCVVCVCVCVCDWMLVSQVVDRLNTELARTRLDVGRSLSSASLVSFRDANPVGSWCKQTDRGDPSYATDLRLRCLPCHVLLLWMTGNSTLLPCSLDNLPSRGSGETRISSNRKSGIIKSG